MAIVVTKAKYINHALVPEEPLNLREGETVEISILVPREPGLVDTSPERLKELEALLGSIKGVSVPLEATRRETIYDDRSDSQRFAEEVVCIHPVDLL